MLTDIELNEAQMAEVKDKLDSWRVAEKQKIESELTEKFEQMEAELKERYENLVEEIKDNMKKVYTKRFTKALKEMYDQIRAEVIVESLNSPESKALEEVKAAVFPFINEATSRRYNDEFGKLAQMYESTVAELELAKGAKKKAELLKSLSPEVSKVVDKLIGEGTEEEVVVKFSTLKEAFKNQEAAAPVVESKKSSPASTIVEHEEVVIERQVENTRTQEIEESNDNDEIQKVLDEQLRLCGIRK